MPLPQPIQLPEPPSPATLKALVEFGRTLPQPIQPPAPPSEDSATQIPSGEILTWVLSTGIIGLFLIVGAFLTAGKPERSPELAGSKNFSRPGYSVKALPPAPITEQKVVKGGVIVRDSALRTATSAQVDRQAEMPRFTSPVATDGQERG